jgi:3-oxoacyl-[acyl-carrier protein] reductase
MSTIQHERGARVPPIKVYPDKYAGHVVVVTGSGSGIGEATARLFAEQGAQVVMFDVHEGRLETVRKSLQEAGYKADTQICDVSNEQSVAHAIEETIKRYHKIDALVNIAGVYPFHPLVGYPTDLYRRAVLINLDGSFFLTREVLPHMQKAGYGRIIHTSSSTFGEPEPGLAAYVASKGGVIGLMRAAAVEAGPGVTVNVVMPGLTETPGITSQEGHAVLFDTVVAKQTVKRRGHPLDIAHAFSFIASPEAAFFSGQIFDCSGGETFH